MLAKAVDLEVTFFNTAEGHGQETSRSWAKPW